MGTIGGGCGPRVDLDTLSYGKSGRFLDTIDKIKGSSVSDGEPGFVGKGVIPINRKKLKLEKLRISHDRVVIGNSAQSGPNIWNRIAEFSTQNNTSRNETHAANDN